MKASDMMSKLSTTKGKDFERKVAAQLRELWPDATIHRSSQADRAYAPDVVIEGDAPQLARRLWLELNDARNPQPLKKLERAERDLKLKSLDDYRWERALPVVVWHRLGSKSIQATMRMRTMAVLCGGAYDCSGQLVVTCDWEALLAMGWTAPPAPVKDPATLAMLGAALRALYPASTVNTLADAPRLKLEGNE